MSHRVAHTFIDNGVVYNAPITMTGREGVFTVRTTINYMEYVSPIVRMDAGTIANVAPTVVMEDDDTVLLKYNNLVFRMKRVVPSVRSDVLFMHSRMLSEISHLRRIIHKPLTAVNVVTNKEGRITVRASRNDIEAYFGALMRLLLYVDDETTLDAATWNHSFKEMKDMFGEVFPYGSSVKIGNESHLVGMSPQQICAKMKEDEVVLLTVVVYDMPAYIVTSFDGADILEKDICEAVRKNVLIWHKGEKQWGSIVWNVPPFIDGAMSVAIH